MWAAGDLHVAREAVGWREVVGEIGRCYRKSIYRDSMIYRIIDVIVDVVVIHRVLCGCACRRTHTEVIRRTAHASLLSQLGGHSAGGQLLPMDDKYSRDKSRIEALIGFGDERIGN